MATRFKAIGFRDRGKSVTGRALSSCGGAAAGGHLDVLQWARQNGCPWCEDLDIWNTADLDVIDCCARAAAGGHLAVLQWAREHGCPWSAATRDLAATMGYSDDLPLSV